MRIHSLSNILWFNIFKLTSSKVNDVLECNNQLGSAGGFILEDFYELSNLMNVTIHVTMNVHQAPSITFILYFISLDIASFIFIQNPQSKCMHGR